MLTETMLACGYDAKKLAKHSKKQWLLSQKIDGIRCYIDEPKLCNKHGTLEQVFTRSHKRVPNHYIRKMLAQPELIGFDGELISMDEQNSFKAASSTVMTQEGEPAFLFVVFNYFGDGSAEFCAKPLHERMIIAGLKLSNLRTRLGECPSYIQFISFIRATSPENACEFVAKEWAPQGLEGGVLTTEDAPYLQRRAKASEPFAVKIKPMQDSEHEIIGFEPEYYGNDLVFVPREKWGTAKELLGALRLRTPEGEEFKCGTGFSLEDRQEIWANRANYLGKLAKVKYLPSGSERVPRHPVYLGIRDADDL